MTDKQDICFYVGSYYQAFLIFLVVEPPIPEHEVKRPPFAVGLLHQKEGIWQGIQLGKSIACCYDSTVITGAKTFYIQIIETLFDLMVICLRYR